MLLNKSVVIILAVLQFFAPLVHAHTGPNHINSGIHVPGLETYLGKDYHAAELKNVNSNWQTEGLLVVVDAGIKNSQDLSFHNAGYSLFALVSDFFPAPSYTANAHNFSPHEKEIKFPQFFHTPQSPRAPPLNRAL